MAAMGLDPRHHGVDGEIAMPVEAAISPRRFVDVGHRVEADVAGKQLLDLQIPSAEGQDARFGIGLAFENALHDGHHPRMNAPDQTGTGGLKRLGNEPGEALVIADASDQSNLAGQIQRNHKGVSRCGSDALDGTARAGVTCSRSWKIGQDEPT